MSSKITIKSVIKDILFTLKEDYILLTDLISQTSKITGYTYASVYGSSFLGTDKFVVEDWFISSYALLNKDTLPRRIAKKSYLERIGFIVKNLAISYDSKPKVKAREFIFNEITGIDRPRILTLAGEQGLDVKMVMERSKNPNIDNVEKYTNILEKYQELNYPTNDHKMSFTKFIRAHQYRKYDLMNYDTMGYLWKYIAADMLYINLNKMTNCVCLTLTNIKKIRNHGPFADFVREKYEDFDDPTKSYLVDIMTNYDLVSEHKYKQRFKKGNGMRIFKFKLKTK